MRLTVTGGGTGGHLFPGIALAAAMQERVPGTQVLFIGTSRLLDQQALADRGFELATLACGGVKGLSLGSRVRNLVQMPLAIVAARRMLGRFRPDLVFGVGGYVTGPVLLAARTLGVPVVIHEQNSVPGMANRLAGRLAALRERDVEQARGFFGVLPEHLVEVAHAVEQQRVGVPGLEGQILLHHGRVVRERVRHAVRCE